MSLNDDEWAEYQAELLDKANRFADVWSRLGDPTHASCAAHVLLAARAFASMEVPLSLEEFMTLCRGMYKMAEAETRNGDLVNAGDEPAPPVLN